VGTPKKVMHVNPDPHGHQTDPALLHKPTVR